MILDPYTALACGLVGAAAIALAFPSPRARLVRTYAAGAASQIALLALVGYIFQASGILREASFIPLPLPAAIALFLASLALLAVRADEGPMALLLGPSEGGKVLRQFGPLVLLAPIAIGWVRLQGEAQDLYDTTFGSALVAMTGIWVAAFVLYRLALAIDQRQAARNAREAELATALAAAEAAAQAKDAFLATMSHELRTPLNAILGYAEILQEEAADEATRADLGRISGAGKQLLGLIEDVLALSALEAAEPADRVPVDLPELLADCLEAVRPVAAKKKLALELDVAPDLPHMTTDARSLDQALGHLLGNAVKFTQAGSVTLAAREEGDEIVLAVRDTGCGMSPEQAARAFEPFVQGESGYARGHDGSGLGLALARLLARNLGGELRCVATAPGQGSTFTLRLPAARS